MNKDASFVPVVFKISSFLFAALIFVLSSIPDLQAPLEFHLADKLLHLLAYVPFSVLLFFSFYTSKGTFWQKYAYVLSLTIGVIYGLLDELHQSFVPGRQSDFFDFLADFLGVAAGLALIWLGLKSKGKTTVSP